MLYRYLLLTATLAGIALRSHAQSNPREQALMPLEPAKTVAGHAVIDGDRASLEALGADLQLHTLQIRGEPFATANLQDGDLALIARHRKLRRLEISAQPAVTGAGLAALQPLANLEDLTLTDLDLSDEHLAALRALPNLRRLDLSYSLGFRRAGLSALATLPSLRSLSLRGCTDLTLDDLAVVASMSKLESLDLRGRPPGHQQWFTGTLDGWISVQIDVRTVAVASGQPQPTTSPWHKRRENLARHERRADADAADRLGRALAELRALRTLRLSADTAGPTAAANLVTKPHLRELEVDTHVLSLGVIGALPHGLRALHVVGGLDDEQCAALAARAHDLTTLVIRDNHQLTTAGLAHLTALPALEHLDVAGCQGLAVLTLPGVLTQAKNLRFVDLTGVKLLPEQLIAIRNRLPNAQVVCPPEPPADNFIRTD